MTSTSNKIMSIFGYKYILNKNTGEVHNIKVAKSICGLQYMSKKNKKYLTERQYILLKGRVENKKIVNGCRFCCKADDIG
jgi:hypothetical protein